MPLSRMSETEKAYFAGLIDGEGHIRYQGHRGQPAHHTTPKLQITNTDLRIIEWVECHVDAWSYGYQRPASDKLKTVHQMWWLSGNAVSILSQVRQYLVAKRDRADIIIRTWTLSEAARESAGGHWCKGHPMPEWLVVARAEALEKMNELNKRGR
jgi:hypothetical protein